jgi:hypothetical protein
MDVQNEKEFRRNSMGSLLGCGNSYDRRSISKEVLFNDCYINLKDLVQIPKSDSNNQSNVRRVSHEGGGLAVCAIDAEKNGFSITIY